MKEKTTGGRSSSRVAWESLEKWARLEIQDWLQELMVVLFQKGRVLAQDGGAGLQVQSRTNNDDRQLSLTGLC